MPGHEVFPRASLSSVIANVPPAAEVPAGVVSNTHELDFVVCDKRMRIVAAVQIKGRLQARESSRVQESLSAAGIRLVMVDSKALPERAQLEALIFGPSGQAGHQ